MYFPLEQFYVHSEITEAEAVPRVMRETNAAVNSDEIASETQ
jgi:hypothetical protein